MAKLSSADGPLKPKGKNVVKIKYSLQGEVEVDLAKQFGMYPDLDDQEGDGLNFIDQGLYRPKTLDAAGYAEFLEQQVGQQAAWNQNANPVQHVQNFPGGDVTWEVEITDKEDD